jgi:hypothetical protein
VLTTVNIQHLESLIDVVRRITGVEQMETIPDSVLRGADQIELIDVSPEQLRERLAAGDIYDARAINAELANYFRPGNLTALRELALLWLADEVDASLRDYHNAHNIRATWEARERIVVALPGGPEGGRFSSDEPHASPPDPGAACCWPYMPPPKTVSSRPIVTTSPPNAKWSNHSAAPTTEFRATGSPTTSSNSPAATTRPSS